MHIKPKPIYIYIHLCAAFPLPQETKSLYHIVSCHSRFSGISSISNRCPITSYLIILYCRRFCGIVKYRIVASYHIIYFVQIQHYRQLRNHCHKNRKCICIVSQQNQLYHQILNRYLKNRNPIIPLSGICWRWMQVRTIYLKWNVA